ncbi:gamma-glutamylcyclotransferase family protein [Streptomyces sp. NPDC001502]|uniref:gamma-glutamylcyclotransferase family protein n=1 Tax=Streptomyces sp. NPDC001502 TaxID=3364578 RepID=UPI0036C116C6
MQGLTTHRIARRPARSARLSPGDMLFCYGTLRFDAVLHALLSRVPERQPDSAPGWRTAALAGRQYPGLVAAADAVAPGLLLNDLTLTDWDILDAFEDTLYDLREVTLVSGRRAWAYIWTEGEVLPHDWDAALFEAEDLAEYAARCARIAPALAAGGVTP